MDRQEIINESEHLKQVLPRMFVEGIPFVVTMMQELVIETKERGLEPDLGSGLAKSCFRAYSGKSCNRLVMYLENIHSNQGPLTFSAIAELSRESEIGKSLDWQSGFAEITTFDIRIGVSLPSHLCPLAFKLKFIYKDGEMVLTED